MARVFKYRFCELLVAAFILTLCPPIQGQNINAGLFGGITASQVDGDAYSGFNKLGLTGGAFVNRHINYNIFWQVEVKYVIRGVYKGLEENDPTLYRSGYHYVEVPLSVHYLYNEQIQLELGTSPEVLVTTRIADENGVIDPVNYPDNRRIGLSVFGGFCYWFNANTGVGIRYTYSAIPFRDPQEWNHPRYRGYYHKVISLTAAYRFSKK